MPYTVIIKLLSGILVLVRSIGKKRGGIGFQTVCCLLAVPIIGGGKILAVSFVRHGLTVP